MQKLPAMVSTSTNSERTVANRHYQDSHHSLVEPLADGLHAPLHSLIPV